MALKGTMVISDLWPVRSNMLGKYIHWIALVFVFSGHVKGNHRLLTSLSLPIGITISSYFLKNI